MADPFTIGLWDSEGRLASPQEIFTELSEHLLPADPFMPMEFTGVATQNQVGMIWLSPIYQPLDPLLINTKIAHYLCNLAIRFFRRIINQHLKCLFPAIRLTQELARK